MSSADRYDAAVVGAGPAGSWAARALADRGHRVALIDENEGPREEVVCTGIVGREAYDRFDLPEWPVVDRIEAASFFSPSGVEVVYEPPEPLARVVDRTRFDGSLGDRAREAGADLLRGCRARSVDRRPDGVRLGLEGKGERRTLETRSLVAATGHQRWLHGDAGFGDPPDYVHGVHADVRFEDLERAELYFGREVAPGYFAWAVPFGDGTARLGVLAEQGARKYFAAFLRRPEIRGRLPAGDDRDLERIRGRRLRSRGIVQGPVRPCYADRALAVGEAAGQVKTTTAGGIYYGLIGAERAAEVLSGALEEGNLSAERLSAYEEAWLDQLGGEIEAGKELQRVGREMEDEEIDRLFEALQDGVASALREVVRFDWHRPALRVLFGRREAWSFLKGKGREGWLPSLT